MDDGLFEEMGGIISSNSFFSLIPISFDNFVYEERVKINCFYCNRYNQKWTCPPRIPNLNYKKILAEYENLAILKYEQRVNKNNFEDIRNKSTNDVHKKLLELECFLYQKNRSMAISFIGGSCKLCKDGCGKEQCSNQGKARIPLEATGINIIKTLGNIGIIVRFPIENILCRFGLIAW